MENVKVLVYCFLLFHFIPTFNTLETILPGQSVKGNETLTSTDGTFEAGFFNFDDSNNHYFGIWYKDISPRTVVWIANRDSALENSSGVLNLTVKGTLVILDSKGVMIWSSNTSKTETKPIVQLLENGNLVVKDEWRSFDFPGDTLLPGMRIQSSLVNGDYKGLVSWREAQDPSTGLYSYHIDTNGFPQVVITKGNTLLIRVGSWNGNILSGISSVDLYKSFNISFVITEIEVSYGYELLDKSVVSRYMLTSSGQITRFLLSNDRKSWQIFFDGPMDRCDNYAICGANSNCDLDNSPICECLDGFIPKSLEKWNSQNWSDGCVRRVKLDCDDDDDDDDDNNNNNNNNNNNSSSSDGFLKQVGMKLPDTSKSWFNKSINLEECGRLCLRNCSCTSLCKFRY